MPLSLSRDQYSPCTQQLKDLADVRALTPRVKMALRIYAYGSVRSMAEAAVAMDLNEGYLSLMKNSIPGKAFMESAEQIIADKTLDGHELLNRLGRRALEVTAGLMENSDSDNIKLKAAIDLTDRSPEYSKVQKMEIQSFTLTGKDAKSIADALVRGRSVHEQYAQLASGDYNRITDEQTTSNSSPSDS